MNRSSSNNFTNSSSNNTATTTGSSSAAYNAIKSNYRSSALNYDDEEDTPKFGNRFGNRFNRDQEEELNSIQERIGRVENESLESTQRALRVLNETHEIGVKTAEELVRQGEKLENVNSKLDDVDETLNATQKNINQIKSIFGGFKNKFFKGSSPATSTADQPRKDAMSSSKSANNLGAVGNSVSRGQQAVITGSDREKEINSNLDEMSTGLARLRGLASEMSFELDRQNPIIDQLNEKTTRTQAKIDNQNAQIKRVLK